MQVCDCNYVNDTTTANGAARTRMGMRPRRRHRMIILRTCMDAITMDIRTVSHRRLHGHGRDHAYDCNRNRNHGNASLMTPAFARPHPPTGTLAAVSHASLVRRSRMRIGRVKQCLCVTRLRVNRLFQRAVEEPGGWVGRHAAHADTE